MVPQVEPSQGSGGAESRGQKAGALLVAAIFALSLGLGTLVILVGRLAYSPDDASANAFELPAPPIMPDAEAAATLNELKLLRGRLKTIEDRLAFLTEEKKELTVRVRTSEERVQQIKGKLRESDTAVGKMQSALDKESALREAEKRKLDFKRLELDKLQSELDKLQSELARLRSEKAEADQKVRDMTPVEVKIDTDKLQPSSWPSLLQEKFAARSTDLQRALERLENTSLATREKLSWVSHALNLTDIINKGLAKYPITDLRASQAKDFVEDIELKLHRLRR